MKAVIRSLVDKLADDSLSTEGVIPWASPVLFFGDASKSKIATVGINPSNREFVDEKGFELHGKARRFPTLRSLGIRSWAECDDAGIESMIDHSVNYFSNSPYGLWFNKLEALISQTGCSYYSKRDPACHLDMVPFATADKWMALSTKQKKTLMADAGSTLGSALHSSQIELLVLNGTYVINAFVNSLNINLAATERIELALPRKTSTDIAGICYEGSVSEIDGRDIGRVIKVIGFNHNIQSSFGVTSGVVKGLSKWVGCFSNEDRNAPV